ncbi:MAG: bifunctional diaminohydroxyphosphoribosylaminopyrimidine deaminase/5-amino-6-(5-phosphoribosylamino)uracil reductase RibD [Roseibium sp.]|uniref:bifunctional diaminohydroxyphosphoribosylaminopyrimidine deaminase/5-amino-6-(5-phosphoribosylamino)uracil reductase RibD n=1 Tax=Roseibium sp. TaxID=1936156 RepID=UPI001B105376|nr:bifunctional diaminohydroxyphosphoribosylaminopyrimidine deaminase/5-amino-6-(5-phosphoribosylamino)uracil reductase RibD [Roseibium sp.]MBO6891017.1 bifunctional diaminohydroxyphosphoribosylaminopyrimidine deaminase/5-amino-6-(5-phosphoribosylamino)uracil reductase RibD [Roseibium sp.]MBO6932229.1 bifunctional diaminohydroxyphosphoribosylaminopyrimidine deaminase/5-amino-6-(5-phosphoribosylamino)uracil reductase RibD [Roseibium sp.]
MSDISNTDKRFMAAAGRLARRGLGRVWPNPAVAALIVHEDGESTRLVGRGVTSRPGMAHAEVNALNQAGDLARGATCYVTLEPCSHYGRTPPCSLALIKAGVKRVVVGMLDPNPRVAGRGVKMLEEAGVEVVVGVCEAEMKDLYKGFMLRQLKQRPQVFLKLAKSADGYIGRSGEGQVKISGPLSMRKVHGFRAEYDAILVGSGTALADDPQLTCRLPGLAERSPVRVIIDRCARLSLESKLVRTCVDVPVWLICGNDADAEKIEVLSAAGVNIIRVPASDCSIKPSVILSALATRGITRVMLEGGARMASSFLLADLVDDLCVVTGDLVIGEDGIEALHGLDLADVMKDPKFERVAAGKFGADRYQYLRRRGA